MSKTSDARNTSLVGSTFLQYEAALPSRTSYSIKRHSGHLKFLLWVILPLLSITTAISRAQSIAVTITSADQTQLLSQQTPISFGSSAPTGNVMIGINYLNGAQTWEGVGAAITDSAASVISGLGASAQTSLLQSLFSPTAGAGLNWIRDPMGASDFTASGLYTYDDGAADPNLTNFSIAHDEKQIIPVIKQAQAINPAVKVIITPWSPPAWMTVGDSTEGSYLNTGYESSLAQYFVRTIQGYESNYVPIYAMAVQNEPEYMTTSYPSMGLDSSDELSTINYSIGPALASAGQSSTKILGYDHNLNDTSYPETVAASQYVAGSAFHCYQGSISNMKTVLNYTNKPVYMTECTTGSNTFAYNLTHDSYLLYFIEDGASSVVWWNAVLNQNNGPNLSSAVCQDCLGVVNVNTTTGVVSPSPDYYILAQIGRFAVPGAQVLTIATQNTGGVLDTAFWNPDGSYAVVTYNSNSTAQPVTINWNNLNANYSLPAQSYTTFKWQGSAGVHIAQNTYFTVTNVNSGLCADATGYGTTSGTALQQWTCGKGQTNQLWQFIPVDSGYYRIVSEGGASNEVVWDVDNASSASGAKLELNLWSHGTAAQWKPTPLANGQWEFVNRNSGDCMDVPGSATGSGVVLDQSPCNGGTQQAFTLAGQ